MFPFAVRFHFLKTNGKGAIEMFALYVQKYRLQRNCTTKYEYIGIILLN